MTHDTDHPKETVEERVFVPPNEQHVREDGVPTEPAEATEERVHAERGDADRVDATGTEAIPHPPRETRDPDGTLVDSPPAEPMPATPLDTGTAEDAERTEEMGAEDETRAGDLDGRNVDTGDVNGRNVDMTDVDMSNVDRRDPNTVDVDAIEVDAIDVDSEPADADDVYGRDVDSGRVDAGDVAVGTATVPEQATASTAEFWPTGVVDELRGRWDSVQIRFVDDPSGVAADARALVGEAVTAIRQAIDSLEAKLDEAATDASDNVSDETERLRQQVAHYRNVFESLLRR